MFSNFYIQHCYVPKIQLYLMIRIGLPKVHGRIHISLPKVHGRFRFGPPLVSHAVYHSKRWNTEI